ncbi:MAG: hypothetical protein ACLT3D_03305 [Lawsonibacter sp.]
MLELIGLVAGLLIGAFFPLDHPSPVVLSMWPQVLLACPGLGFGRLPRPG